MKYLKRINEDFKKYDHFGEISPEQAYKELENEFDDNKDEFDGDIKDEVDYMFNDIENEGLDPYEMSFDEFYEWISKNYKLNQPKSEYEKIFKEKKYPKNPNQLELFDENKKIKSFNQWS